MSQDNNNSKKIIPTGSYCVEKTPKDRVIFLTKDDLNKPVKDEYLKYLDDDNEPGIVLQNGQINWACPCLGNMASGPCAATFRKAFSCFHYSEAELKGIDCISEFDKLQECMQKYPKLFNDKKKQDFQKLEDENK